MKQHNSNSTGILTRYRFVCFVAAIVLLFMTALSGTASAAAIVVNSTAQPPTPPDSLCTLSEAIANANADADVTSGDCIAGSGADTITFTGAGVGTITPGGTLFISDAAGLTINGGTQVTISGGGSVGVFRVSIAASLTLESLTVKDGYVAAFAGGGIFNDSGTVTITNSTLSGNSADSGGGIFNRGTVTITNSIVANSPMSGNCDNAGIFTANGNNLDTDGTCPGFGQVTSAQLNLGPLFFNGGPTKTHALLPGSFAIDAGVQTECTADGITTDQRGVPRDAHCDIGSFEFVPPPPSAQGDLSIAKSAAKTAQTGRQLTYTITVKNNGPDSASGVVVKDVLPAGTSFVSVSAPGATSCLMPAPQQFPASGK